MAKFHRIDLGVTKVFLLECPGGYLLIDTGYEDTYSKFLKALDRFGVEPFQIRYLLLTHHHDDHAGFANKLVSETGCRVIVHRDAIPYLSTGVAEDTSRPVNACICFIFSIFSLFHREFAFPPLVLKEDAVIIEGDDDQALRLIGIDGMILHTPGHTQDSISVLLDDGTAFVGDVAMNFLNFCQIKYRPIYVQDINQVFESWRKLIDKGARHCYPAHGKDFPIEKLVRK